MRKEGRHVLERNFRGVFSGKRFIYRLVIL